MKKHEKFCVVMLHCRNETLSGECASDFGLQIEPKLSPLPSPLPAAASKKRRPMLARAVGRLISHHGGRDRRRWRVALLVAIKLGFVTGSEEQELDEQHHQVSQP